MLSRLPTAPIAAAGLVGGYAVAAGTGNRPLGGVVLAGFGLACIAVWRARDSRRVTLALTATGLSAFAVSHALALAIGPWPSVLLCAAATALACHRLSDARRPVAARSRTA
jgi:tetrahydromethanopterin S-methyltransferase subunit C